MKNILVLLALTALPLATTAQDVLDKVADGACSCLHDKADAIGDAEQMKVQFGLCFLSAANPYEKELRKKYNVDLTQITNEGGESLGRLIAPRMAARCPDELAALMQKISAQDQAVEEEEAVTMIRGEVVKATKDRFLWLMVRGEDGRTIELLWLDHVSGAEHIDLSAPQGTKAGFAYVQRELLDPASGAYRSYDVLTAIVP